LFYRKRNGREQFNQDFYDDLRHRRGGWDLCIDIEAPKERFEGFEKIDQGIVTLADIFDRLVDATGVTKIWSIESK